MQATCKHIGVVERIVLKSEDQYFQGLSRVETRHRAAH